MKENEKKSDIFNPLVPVVLYIGRLAKIFDFNVGSDSQKKKKIHERREYESLDEKAYLELCHEKLKKKNSDTNGLMAY